MSKGLLRRACRNAFRGIKQVLRQIPLADPIEWSSSRLKRSEMERSLYQVIEIKFKRSLLQRSSFGTLRSRWRYLKIIHLLYPSVINIAAYRRIIFSINFRKWMTCGSWQLSVPLYALYRRRIGMFAPIGLGTRVCASSNHKNEILFWPISPRLKHYPAATRYPEVSGKRKSGKREWTGCFAQTLRSKSKSAFFSGQNARSQVEIEMGCEDTDHGVRDNAAMLQICFAALSLDRFQKNGRHLDCSAAKWRDLCTKLLRSNLKDLSSKGVP